MLIINLNVAISVRIFSSATIGGSCQDEILYGTPQYVEKLRQVSERLLGIESGYVNMRLYLILPIHFGCKLIETEIVVISPSDLNIPSENYEDLTDDIRNNLDDEIEVKLIVVDHLSCIPQNIRSRLYNIRPVRAASLAQIATNVDPPTRPAPAFVLPAPNVVMENEQSTILHAIAAELAIQIINIQFDPYAITVILANPAARRLHNHFITMARARTRRIVRIASLII